MTEGQDGLTEGQDGSACYDQASNSDKFQVLKFFLGLLVRQGRWKSEERSWREDGREVEDNLGLREIEKV